ncbi:TetR/AcrR family transcriptional regulator C-terminal domain-containing protein [Streptomyces hesseae]|uniref:TetR/AcrR family transcriptional regulator C-terminal domain-containing protein n=1 Tax=Streptomyces hesseae TaxID=3075519 RepID=A0ABU2SPB7_9ACTN|nr:TetR/AcrR family transcriptional regulator C-terminal domain-containing protein [Streptomyces sp. DSM 40473]MDT0450730.1 TetR/AcrR family transcriptional regulator C-terminal domain-containing protein [Streptomyces sp. DSM 40473]
MTSKRTRGERAGLTREIVLDAALGLIDREGRAALTMRRLGAELGVEAMTLYHHVPNKDALLDGLVERVFAEALPLPGGPGNAPGDAPGDAPGSALGEALGDGEVTDWRTFLRAYADSLRAALLRHPGVLPLITGRPAVTPATLDAVERGLRTLTSAGFALGPAVDTLNALSLFVVGHTAAEADARPSQHSAQTTPGTSAWLAELDCERYPLVVEAAGTGAGTDDAERFGFAVDAMLTGFGAAAGLA